LLKVRLHGDKLKQFLNDWDYALTGMNPVPETAILETLFRNQLERSTAMRDAMSYCNRLDLSREDRTYDFLISSLKKHISKTRRGETCNELQQALLDGQGHLAVLSVGEGNPKGGRNQKDQARAERGAGNEDTRAPKGHCRAWIRRGKFDKSDCSFIHDDAMKGRGRSISPGGRGRGRGRGSGSGRGRGRSRSPSTTSSASSTESKDKKSVCKFHLKSKCNKGKECPNGHSPPCRFCKQNRCTSGEDYIFVHAHPVATPAGPAGAEVKQPSSASGSDSDLDGLRSRGSAAEGTITKIKIQLPW